MMTKLLPIVRSANMKIVVDLLLEPVKRLALVLTMTSLLAACDDDADKTSAIPRPPPEPQAQVLLEQNFEGLTALPAGWVLPSTNQGSVHVRDGSLFIDGRAHSTQMTTVMLPAALHGLSNYRIDVVFTFLESNNATRWGSVMYRAAPASAGILNASYYQYAIRPWATAFNGTEFAVHRNGGLGVHGSRAFSENINRTKTYTATVLVHGNSVQQYLNGTLTHHMVLDEDMASGGIGLQTSGLVMRVDSVKVTEQLSALLPEIGKLVGVQDSGTQAAMAPTLVQSMAEGTNIGASGASNALYTLDATLTLSAHDGVSMGTLAQYLAQDVPATIAVLRISDAATVNALAVFAKKHDITDVTLLSDDVGLLANARAALPNVRTAVDFSNLSILGTTTQDILQVVSATNRAKAKIAVLPPAMTQRATVSHLQRLLITPWARSDASTPTDAARVLTTGVNGVLSADTRVFAEVLRALPAGTLLRKPLIIGHRGMPSITDENTLEGARAAVAAGADTVEYDIFKTADHHLVIIHDVTVNRTTTGTGNIESMTLAQVKALRTLGRGYEIPTLREFFQEFKGKPITHFVEIKSGNANIVPLLKQELDDLGVRDQTVVMSSDGIQLVRMGATLPEMSVGFVNTAPPLLHLRNLMVSTQQYSSTFNPSYANLTAATMEAGKHRGITFWPWTLNDRNAFHRFYSYGTHGITTNYAWWASDFPVAVASVPAVTVDTGPFTMPVMLTTQVGTRIASTSNAAAVIGGTAPHIVGADGSITFTGPGSAVLLPGYRHAMGDGTYDYVIVGQPVDVRVR
ncbi:MAG: glycerophosphodiester phosphodiesterase family protein [Moraxellaceae bacterium]|nr:glycerophosphodiester phosphodiesterase family protein [Moraxellaceae bacterium]